VRGTTATADDRLRDVLSELVRVAGLVRHIGVILNQAVARLNATGQRSADLLPYAAESIRRSELAVRSALTDDGQPPLEAAGLRLQERLQTIRTSIERVGEKGRCRVP
jgi:hypothetical protein